MSDNSNNSHAKKVVPWVIAIALFMQTLDVTIINTAVPKIAEDLLVNALDLRFALTSYLLSLALFMPLSGWVADRWGAQRTFMFALLLFTLSSIACGRSTTLAELVLARIFQGLGGAFMMPVGNLIIVRTFPKSELVRAMNFVAIPAKIGPLVGPVMGGFITSYYSWPWIFYVNVPVGVLGILVAWRYIENSRSEIVRSFDTKGFMLFGLSLAGLFFGLEGIILPVIKTSWVLFVLLCAGLGFLLFYKYYKKTPEPLWNLKLFSIRTFFVAALGNLWMRIAMGGVLFLLPLLLQLGYGASPLESGLLTCGWTLGSISAKSTNRALVRRWGFRKTLMLASMLTGICVLSFSLIGGIYIPLIVTLVFVGGLVASSQNSALNVLYYADVAQGEMSQATAISSTLQQLSMGLGITLSTLILQFFIGWHHVLVAGHPIPFRYTFIVMGAIVSLGIFIFFRLRPNDGQGVVS